MVVLVFIIPFSPFEARPKSVPSGLDSNQALEGTYTDDVLTESKNLSLSNDSVAGTDNNSFYFLEVDTDMYKDGTLTISKPSKEIKFKNGIAE